ncbi:MAG: hypothetical protein AB8I80_21290 [Anaerolineae bacterium]
MAGGYRIDTGSAEGKTETAREGEPVVVVEDRPTRKTWYWILLVLTEILSVGVVAYLTGQVTTLMCDRAEPAQVDCIVQAKWLGLVSLREQSVRSVRGARVAENCDEDGCTYRVELVTDSGAVPLAPHYSLSYPAKERVAQRVNDFVTDPTATSLAVQGRLNPSMLLVLALVVAEPLLWWLWRRYRFGASLRS